MTTLSIKTAMVALVAGSLAMTAGGTAFARADGAGMDPAKFQQRIEKRVDKALDGTTATADQKKKITEILQAAFGDMKGMHTQRAEVRKALTEAMSAPTIDAAKVEQIRAQQIKLMDDGSRRFTKALIDAGNVLNAEQRQAFFKKWNERSHGPRKG
ncbi:periplasmic heavy metal sensor [Reyranella sp.]|uniref:Spy/CpxP family protein refolding chaperone n=1 Tax=Reyranella sp. TaxID=1929291 RepID=UPI0025D2D533|nr:periplasmic heavy metal sensor [Reyranella sp.]